MASAFPPPPPYSSSEGESDDGSCDGVAAAAVPLHPVLLIDFGGDVGAVCLSRVVGKGRFSAIALGLRQSSGGSSGEGPAETNLVAVKLVDFRDDPEASAAVRAEADAFAAVAAAGGSPLVLRALGPGTVWRGLSARALEYAAGGDLMGVLQRRMGAPVAAGAAAVALGELASALLFLHVRSRLWVLDVSLTNTLLDSRGHVKLADFGSARAAAGGYLVGVMCAPEFAAPEVAKTHDGLAGAAVVDAGACAGDGGAAGACGDGEPVRLAGRGAPPYHGGCADWWAFGVVAYELLVSRPPWWDADPEALLALIAGGLPLSFDGARVAVPAAGEALCRDLLSAVGGDDDAGSFRRRCDNAISSHAFFAGIDWERLERQGYDGIDPVTHEEAVAHSRFPEYPLDVIPL